MDLIAAFLYLIHFGVSWVCMIIFYFYYRKKVDSSGNPIPQPWIFIWCWGWMNLMTLSIQLIWPTCAPWYNLSILSKN
jgi:hypothetical protein